MKFKCIRKCPRARRKTTGHWKKFAFPKKKDVKEGGMKPETIKDHLIGPRQERKKDLKKIFRKISKTESQICKIISRIQLVIEIRFIRIL